MRIDQMMAGGRTMSFEIFPPKQGTDDDLSKIGATLESFKGMRPDFVSVTYGAGGSNSSRAAAIAEIVISHGMTPLSHITAVCADEEETGAMLEKFTSIGVENVLALRGDPPQGRDPHDPSCWPHFRSAVDIMRFIKSRSGGELCVGGSAYPEGHPSSISPEADIDFMITKVSCGAKFFISQLFFDDDHFKSFASRARARGLKEPIVPGIMPMLSKKQLSRIVELSGTKVPPKLDSLIDRFGHDDASMREAGLDFAAEQIEDLWGEGFGVHIYTMNRPKSTADLIARCGIR